MKKKNPNFKHSIALIGATTDIGAGARGGAMGPEAIRVAGLEQALRNLGHEVIDYGNIQGPTTPIVVPGKEREDGLRNLNQTRDWCVKVRDAFYASLKRGELPVLLGGDHSLTIGTIPAIAKYCEEKKRTLSILWLDAHADFNTAETSPSGNIHGMPAAVLNGYGHPKLLGVAKDFCKAESAPASLPCRFFSKMVQVGIRSVDAKEKIALSKSKVQVFDMRKIDELGMRVVMEQALKQLDGSDTHLHVSFDVDFLDPVIAPGVATTVLGGPNYREAQLCMEMIYDSGLLGSLDIVELNPAFDHRNTTAELTVELVESIFGKQTLARNPLF